MSSVETICEFIVELGDALCQLQLGREFYIDFDNVFVLRLIGSCFRPYLSNHHQN